MRKHCVMIRNAMTSDGLAIQYMKSRLLWPVMMTEHWQTKAEGDEAVSDETMLSLVAEQDGRVMGHIACFPVEISDHSAQWYGIEHALVLPEYQHQCIGKLLTEAVIARLRDCGVMGCCVYGQAEGYFKLGFHRVAGLTIEGVSHDASLMLPFTSTIPQGTIKFDARFSAPVIPSFD